MSNRKTYNSIVFLTVYLGLALVGASPQVLAQNVPQTIDSRKIQIIIPSEGYVFTFDINSIIKLNELVSAENLPINMSAKLIPAGQKFPNWEVITAVGDQKIIDFLQKEFFAPVVTNLRIMSSPTGELFQSVEINKNDITRTRNLTLGNVQKAAQFGRQFRFLVEEVKNTSDITAADKLYLTNTQVRSENNQVFIVTRLPRASIDSLLAQKDAQ